MSTPSETVDVIDRVLGLDSQGGVYAARIFRDKVRQGTQASYDALFSSSLALSLPVRWLVAVYVCQLTKATELHEHYVAEAKQAEVPTEWLQAIAQENLDAINDPVVRAILIFARTLTLKPIEGDKTAIQHLEQSGVPTADCIAVSQLIAFLSYQVRLVTGLKAMLALEK